MPAPKKLTIGVSVNLQRYENLRLAVEGEVATDEDAQDLALYLDRVLAQFGRNDPETALQIDRYRQRVMPVSDACVEAETERAPVSGSSREEPEDATPAGTPGPAAVSPGPVAAPGFLSRREGGVPSGDASAPVQVPDAPAGPGRAETGGLSASPKSTPPPAPSASSGSAPAAPAAPLAAPAGAKGARVSPAADDHGCCEACGAALSRQEAKLSRLFVDRLLCKKCLDSLQR